MRLSAPKGKSDNMTFKIKFISISLVPALLMSAPALAQQYSANNAGATSAEAISAQARGAEELRAAIKRLALRPTDTDALIDAGNAALLLGDAKAALNFFTRADALQPSQGRIKLGMAIANVRTENPFDALRMFDEAVKLGIAERTVAPDRALAYDLLGNFTRAQFDYNLARTAGLSDRLLVQQAVSLSLGGNHDAADDILLPLLRKNYGEAWRARAFLLAARGDFKESRKVARGFMDIGSASRIERYLRLMPKLTGAQQAAAINLGHFPYNNIGKDSNAVKNVADAYGQNGLSGDGRLIPSGDPLGTKTTSQSSRKARTKSSKKAAMNVNLPASLARPVAGLSQKRRGPLMPIEIAQRRIISAEKAAANLVAAPLPVPAPILAPAIAAAPVQKIAVPVEQPKIAAAKPDLKPKPEPKPAPKPAQKPKAIATPKIAAAAEAAPKVIAAPPIAPKAAPKTISAAQDSVPAIADLIEKVTAPSPTIASAPVNKTPVNKAPANTPSVQNPPEQKISGFDLGKIVNAIEIPENEKKSDVVPVDLDNLPPVKKKKAPEKNVSKNVEKKADKIAVPANPARYWVQIATGDAGAFPGDMRIKRRKFPALFKNRYGWSSPWSRSSRLVVGPFDDLKSAKKWEADYREEGGDSYVWRSGNGTKVDPLPKK